MIKAINSFLFGLTLPLRAAKLICTHRTLLVWSAIPVLLSVTVHSYLFLQLQQLAQKWLTGTLTHWGMDPSGWSMSIILFLGKLFVMLAGILSFSIVASTIASPFNDVLAEKSEALIAPPLPPTSTKIQLFSGAQLKILTIDITKSIVAAGMGLFALAVSWIPLINLVAAVALMLLICFQFTSYPQTRRGLGLIAGLRFLKQHFSACLGFGISASLGFALPLISVIFLPIAVVSGTWLVARAELEK